MKSLASLLQSSSLSLHNLLATHCRTIRCGCIADIYLSNRVLGNYLNCGEFGLAQKLFDEMRHRDSVSWNTMIAGYASRGNLVNAWGLFRCMRSLGFDVHGHSFSSILKGVAYAVRFDLGQQVHSLVIKTGLGCNLFVGSALVDMYAKCERVEDALEAFQEIPEPNSVSWSGLIAGFVKIGDIESAFWLLRLMEMEDVKLEDGTFAPILTLLDDPCFYDLLTQVHGKVLKLGLDYESTVRNAMITSYAECGSILDAKRVFDTAVGSRDLVTWNATLAAFFVHEQEEHALELFLDMQETGIGPDIYTYTSILSALSGKGRQMLGKSLHDLVIKKGLEHVTSVSNALMMMYLQTTNRTMEDAVRVFESLECKDLVSWNSILTGFSQKGLSQDTLKFFRHLISSDIEVDHYSFSAVLRSCSDLATLQLGQQVHALATKSGFESNEFVASSLIFMYSKCGVIMDARKSFEETSKDSTIAWNTMILGYAQHGSGQVALDLFAQMRNRNVKLDHTTFTAVLTACSHVGLVQQGIDLLNTMEPVFRISPRVEHYACAVDLLGRAGLLNKAKNLIESMPLKPDPMVWKTFLGACRACRDIELATQVANHLLEIEPEEHCTYVLLSDMYSQMKKWDEKAKVKKMMRERGVKKVPGWSWIEVRNKVHAFNAEDRSHVHCRDIYLMLGDLVKEIQWSDSDNGFDESLVLGSYQNA
ncbi:PREDICTED: putative pentatricopeptide repeat-containing protein At3g25970 [Tarenaya hassleriana]|uniref:putative pentatricopeptide repeat-containing protein At3g25970 n=1 Tax=Tarenaya hassleriana TaxID=28532 RepID=UPI00053C5588|nr:PREDICTED: putative pentatricopeptide repeat-containing protein At3g25970 [Tarenaya hassleriana]